MIIDDSGRFAGSVSGGCVESAVIQRSAHVLATRKAELHGFGVVLGDYPRQAAKTQCAIEIEPGPLLAKRQWVQPPRGRPAAEQVRAAPTQLARTGSGQDEPRLRAFDETVNFVKQLGDLLDFADEHRRFVLPVLDRFLQPHSQHARREPMETVRMRIIGSSSDTQSLIAVLHGIDGVSRVEEMNDLLPHMDDADSSSAGLPDDMGPGLHSLEVVVGDTELAERVRAVAGRAAEELDANVEFIDEF